MLLTALALFICPPQGVGVTCVHDEKANWMQGRTMFGHVKAEISDLYVLPDPANLGLALRVTSEIADEIEALCPGALTGNAPELKIVGGTAA